MLRTKSPSARAAEAAERQVRVQRRQQRHHHQQQQQQQQAINPASPPAPHNETGIKCLSIESNKRINGNSSSIVNISNNDSNNAIVTTSAVTPASTRGGRFSFGPVPNERYSIESGLSISFSSPSPPTPDDRSCSRRLALLLPHSRQGETASADVSSSSSSGSSNGSDSSSCVAIDVDGIDAETNDDHIVADTDKDLLNSSTTSSIELACQLDHASLTLPPQGEIFGFDSPDQKQQQQQQQQLDDLAPIPFIHGSSNGEPDAALFDFDVDEIDGLIGELAEEEQEEQDQSLAGKLCGQSEQQKQQQEEQQPQQPPPPQLQQQPPQQLEQKDHHRHNQQQDTQENEGEVEQEEQRGSYQQPQQQPQSPPPPPPPPQQQQPPQQPQQQQQQQQPTPPQDTWKGEGEGGETTFTTATAVPTAAAAFVGPAQAILADPVIQQAMGNAMAVAARMDYMTREANIHAAALAAQSQVEVGTAWQTVVGAMHTVAVSLKADNEKLLASNVELEAEKRGFIRRISRLGDTVSMLIAQRDRLAANLQESGAGSPAKTSANGNRNGDDNGCVVYDCTSPAGVMDMSPATSASATTLCGRAAEVATATDTATAATAAVAAFATPTAKPATASCTGAITGQPGSMMTTAVVPVVMNAITEMTATTMAPQQGEVGLPAQTITSSGAPSAVAVPPTTTSTPAPSISASIAKPAPPTTTNEKPKPADRPTPVSSTAAAAALTTAGTAAAPTAPTATAATASTAVTASTAPTATAAAAPTAASTTDATDAAPTPAAFIATPAAPPAPAAPSAAATAATPASVRSKVVGGTSKRRSVNTPGSATGVRSPWVGGGVGGGVFVSPPVMEHREKGMSPPAALSERLENAMGQGDAKRTPLGSARINTGPRSVPSAAGKGRKTSSCVPIPTLGQAYPTRGIENEPAATKPTATVAVKRIISDDKGANGARSKPEGMYGRLRSAGRPRKIDTKVVAGGGKKVVSGTGVSSHSRQEAATNKGAAGGRSKVVSKQRWR